MAPRDYGAGIYYFPAVEAEFGRSLAAWLSAHPELRVVAMASDGTASYGIDRGYWVVMEGR